MPLVSSFNSNYQHKTAIDALKNFLLYESNDDKTNLLSLLHRLNIKKDAISSHSVSIDNLSAIDQQMYPTSFYLSHSELQPCKLRNNSSRRGKPKRFKMNRNRRKNKNSRLENDNFHYRNMITVRRISCHDIRNRFEHAPMKNEREFMGAIRLIGLLGTIGTRKSEKYETYSIGFQSSPKGSNLSEAFVSPSTTNSHSKILTEPISSNLFSQRDVEKKRSDSADITESKVISAYDSSIGSLTSTQLRTTGYDQIKPDVTTETSLAPGSQNDFQSTTTSTAPNVPHFISSPTIPISNIPKTESALVLTPPNENIQDLIDQLKTCIEMLSLLLQNKPEHEKLGISNVKSYSDQKRMHRKKKQSLPPSPLSLSDHSKLNKDNLIFEDITVKRCHSPINQVRTNMINRQKIFSEYPNHLSTMYNDRHNELKRCLLVYCRNRNSNEKPMNSHLHLSRSSPSFSNTEEDDL